jgi:hypothetical protein
VGARIRRHNLRIRALCGDVHSVGLVGGMRLQINQQGDSTMTRNNTIVLSDEERELVEQVKRSRYGDESLPHGFVIGNALRRDLFVARETITATEVASEN